MSKLCHYSSKVPLSGTRFINHKKCGPKSSF